MLKPTHHIPQRHRPQRSRGPQSPTLPLVLAPTAFTNPSILLKANSLGLKSGRTQATAPTRTPALRSPPAPPVCGAPPSRSSTTICPAWVWEREGARGTLETPHQPPLRSTSSRHSRPHRDRCCNQAGLLPTALRHPTHGTLSPGGVGVGQGHGEVEAALIHEHRPVRVDLLDPGQVPPPGLWTLFTGVDRLFFSSIPISVPSGTWCVC